MSVLFKRQPLVCLVSTCGLVTCHEVGESINFKKSFGWRQGAKGDHLSSIHPTKERLEIVCIP